MSGTPRKKPVAWAAGAVAGLLLFGGGYALGGLYGPQPTFAEADGAACGKLTSARNVDEVAALAPEAEVFSVQETVVDKPGYYSGLCTVTADGDQALYLLVEFTGSRDFAAWSENVAAEYVPEDERKKLDVAGGGWSAPQAAAVFVPCTLRDDDSGKERGGLSVIAQTNDGGEHRSDLATLAKRAAEEASSLSGPCQEAAG